MREMAAVPNAPSAPQQSEVPAQLIPQAPQPGTLAVPSHRPWGGVPYGGWNHRPYYGGWNNGGSPWGGNGWGNNAWGNNSWWPWGGNGWGNNGWGNNGWGNNSWWPGGGNGWGNDGWNNSYGSGSGDGWGNTWGDGTGDAAGDVDFSFALRGRANVDMRGEGYGDGYGYGRGYGYDHQGYGPYPPPMMPMPMPTPAQPAEPEGPTDGDSDGVTDLSDLCPASAEGVAVDALGCEETARIVLRGVNFKTDSDELTAESLAILDGVSATLSENPQLRVMVAGHTDSDGDDAYNKDLSQRRAQSVVNYLTNQGVDGQNMIARGFGEEQPIAGNDTTEGKAENRRVELNRL